MTRPNRPRIATAVAAVLAALCTIGLISGPAGAAPARPDSGTGTVLATPKGMVPLRLTASSSGPVSPAFAVTCYTGLFPMVITPYTVSVAASATCTKPMLWLELKVTLYRDDFPWGYGTQIGNQYVAATATGPCLGGDYFAELELDTVWPAGIVGPPDYFLFSGHIWVTC
jgi:hypothetical protein